MGKKNPIIAAVESRKLQEVRAAFICAMLAPVFLPSEPTDAATASGGVVYVGEDHEQCQNLEHYLPLTSKSRVRWVRSILRQVFTMDPTSSRSFSVDRVPGGLTSLRQPDTQQLLSGPSFRTWAPQELIESLERFQALFDPPENGFEAQVADREKVRQRILGILQSHFGLETKVRFLSCD